MALNALPEFSMRPVPPRAPMIKGPEAKELTAARKKSKRLARMYVSRAGARASVIVTRRDALRVSAYSFMKAN
jgi:hypothetical protein